MDTQTRKSRETTTWHPYHDGTAKQALVKLALEPAWEAVFEPNSYGFRPGRSCHDAIGAIFNGIRYKPKFVFDADIKGCFDHIDHEALLRAEHLPETHPPHPGVAQGRSHGGIEFTPTEQGTPQGGVISPLLANVALHGLEREVMQEERHREKNRSGTLCRRLHHSPLRQNRTTRGSRKSGDMVRAHGVASESQ